MAKRVDLPQQSAGDVVHSVFKGTVSSVPVVGGFIAEVLDHVVAPAISGRVEIWRASIDERITDLEGKGYITIADLRNNDEFISVAVKATQYAISTSTAEKLAALRNAVINSALGVEKEEAIQQLFIRFVDELTPMHLRILRLFQDARAWFQEQGRTPPVYHIAGSFPQMIGVAYPELRGDDDLLDLIHSDLTARGLISKFMFRVNMGGDGVYEKRTSKLGDRLLRMIVSEQTPE